MLSNSSVQNPSEQPAFAANEMFGEEKGPDVVKVLWRWKWLAAFGSIIGMSLGYLHFSRQAPTYRSAALVQVVYPNVESAGIETIDGPDAIRGQSRLDESMIIKSARVADMAIELGQLANHPTFEGMTLVEIRDWVLDEKRLEVEPSARDNSTALIDISFICEDAQLSRLVVDSIIAGYDDYLDVAYRNLGDEVVRVVTQAQDNLRTSYDTLSAKHAKFRKEAPMIWLGDEARNQFAENTIEVNASINQLQIESQKVRATLDHIDEAQRQGRSADGTLLMLASDSGLREMLLLNETELLEEKASEALPFSSAERRRLLMEMQMREEELLDTVGEEHPSVASLRRRMESLDRQISSLTDSERQREAEVAIEIADMTPEEKLELWKNSLAERLATLNRQEALLRTLASENELRSKELQEYLTQNNLLNSELASVQSLLDGFTETLNRMQILPEGNRRSLETLTPAADGSFYGPKWAPFLLGGAALGFLCVAGIAMAVDWFDQSFRAPMEVSRALGLPILGHVPHMLLNDKKGLGEVDQALCTYTGAHRDANEAYRAIRTSLYFSENGNQNRVIQVTSPTPGDGKSTLAANLAVSIAQSGRSVLLIDADMRRPRIAKLFGMHLKAGIGEVILGQKNLSQAIVESPCKKLSILASTQSLPNPSEIVSHQRFQEIIAKVRESYDYVIIDTPPVLAVADACAVSARVDGVLLTLRLRRDSKPTATQTATMLNSVGAKVLGVIVNGVTGTEGYDYGYRGYEYGYKDTGDFTVVMPQSEDDEQAKTVSLKPNGSKAIAHKAH